MAIKKSDLSFSLWASCEELRGGMDASQYKDHVLFMLFIKYVSDKYGDSDDFAPPLAISKGASFRDMFAVKGKSDIGDGAIGVRLAILRFSNDAAQYFATQVGGRNPLLFRVARTSSNGSRSKIILVNQESQNRKPDPSFP